MYGHKPTHTGAKLHIPASTKSGGVYILSWKVTFLQLKIFCPCKCRHPTTKDHTPHQKDLLILVAAMEKCNSAIVVMWLIIHDSQIKLTCRWVTPISTILAATTGVTIWSWIHEGLFLRTTAQSKKNPIFTLWSEEVGHKKSNLGAG